jgi:hypothetical protein
VIENTCGPSPQRVDSRTPGSGAAADTRTMSTESTSQRCLALLGSVIAASGFLAAIVGALAL